MISEGDVTRGDVTAAWDVLSRFSASRTARREFYKWCQNPDRHEVVPAVLEHRSHVVNRLTVEQVTKVCQQTGHPLRDIQKKTINDVLSIRDWTTSFAALQVLHFLTEDLGYLVTWDEYCEAIKGEPYNSIWLEPARAAVDHAIEEGFDAQVAADAMTWRLGNFYLSFLREQYSFAYWREAGLPVKQHVLADALFRTDAWVGEGNIDMFIGNVDFRLDRDADVVSTGVGRKTRGYSLLKDASPSFEGFAMQFKVQHAFGTVHLPSKEQLDEAVRFLRRFV